MSSRRARERRRQEKVAYMESLRKAEAEKKPEKKPEKPVEKPKKPAKKTSKGKKK